MHPCDISPNGQRGQRGCFPPASARTTLQEHQQQTIQPAGLPAALTSANSLLGVHHQNFRRDDGRQFDHHHHHLSASFTPTARPEHYSGSPTTTTTTTHLTPPPQQAPTHFGHQTPWTAAPLTGFLGTHFQGSTPPTYPQGDAARQFHHDYFAIERPAGSPHSTGRSEISGSPTLGERTPSPTSQAALLPVKLLSTLSPENQRIVKDADPAHQQAIMEILSSFDFTQRGDIPAEKLQAFYISVPHARSEGDKQGSRGGAAGYTCRWQACPQADRIIKRRDHMINHIRGHFGVKPFPCKFGNGVNLPRCLARFLRADDLKRHVRTVHSKDVDSHFNIVEPNPKNQSKSKRGVTETVEPRRARGCQPYSTSTSDHCRTVSEVANYEFTQPLQAQPHAFFAHGQGQSALSTYENGPFGHFST